MPRLTPPQPRTPQEAAPAPKKEEAKPASDPLSSAPAPSTEAKPKAKPAAAAAAEPEKKKEKAPAAAAEPAKAKARRKSSSGEEPGNGKSSFLEVAVSKPSKIGDGMSSYMVYHVHTKVSGEGAPRAWRKRKEPTPACMRERK